MTPRQRAVAKASEAFSQRGDSPLWEAIVAGWELAYEACDLLRITRYQPECVACPGDEDEGCDDECPIAKVLAKAGK